MIDRFDQFLAGVDDLRCPLFADVRIRRLHHDGEAARLEERLDVGARLRAHGHGRRNTVLVREEMHAPFVRESVDGGSRRLREDEVFLEEIPVAFDEDRQPVRRRQQDRTRAVRALELRAERERLQHVGPAPDATVDEHIQLVAGSLRDRRQRVGAGRRRIELAPAVV